MEGGRIGWLWRSRRNNMQEFLNFCGRFAVVVIIVVWRGVRDRERDG